MLRVFPMAMCHSRPHLWISNVLLGALSVWAASSSHGRHEVARAYDTADQVVLVELNTREGHIGRSSAPNAVEPESDVLQCCALHLLYRACVTEAHREVGHTAMAIDVVGNQMQREPLLSLGDDFQTLRCLVVIHHRRLHPVDKVFLLIHVTGEVQAKAFVQLQRRWGQLGILLELEKETVAGRSGSKLFISNSWLARG